MSSSPIREAEWRAKELLEKASKHPIEPLRGLHSFIALEWGVNRFEAMLPGRLYSTRLAHIERPQLGPCAFVRSHPLSKHVCGEWMWNGSGLDPSVHYEAFIGWYDGPHGPCDIVTLGLDDIEATCRIDPCPFGIYFQPIAGLRPGEMIAALLDTNWRQSIPELDGEPRLYYPYPITGPR